ncbi:hypothetical protein [uncultured Aquimarina sp.]|uniref:hypothetical protein n=1 Tax=uncultured Aquimarina sp. TaxID=575652 RepID=UPI00262CEB85|nr:hypothetical protein [uncultured Aquimarina sp.]
MKCISTKIWSLFIFICIVTSASSQNTLRLKKGAVTDSLLVPETEGVYSIYVPKSFDLKKSWPILFGFDSTENMSNLTHLFKNAAEEFGYVVVVSNYGNKESVSDKSTYMPLLIKHIISLFPIKNKRMYVFGVGKDAPLNTSIPLFYKQFNGVLAINDSYDYDQKLHRNKNFSYFGIVSDENFRYQDFLYADQYLKRRGLTTVLYEYRGDSNLPSENIINKVFPFFTLDAMAKGNIPNDSLWISSNYKKDKENVQLLKKKGKYLDAYDELIKMRKLYSSFLDVDELKREQKELKKIRAFKNERRKRNEYRNRELLLKQSFIISLNEDAASNQYDNLGWWQYKMEELEKLSSNNEPYAKAMKERIQKFLIHVIANYKNELSDTKKEIDKKIFLNILSTIINKKDFKSYKNIISLSARDEDNQTALFYLEKMLEQGYKEMDSLYAIEGTLTLRISKEYNMIVKKYLGSSKFYSY